MKPSSVPKSSSTSPLYFPIEQLTGLSEEDSANLINHGITTTLQLLQKAGRNPSQKEALAIALGVRVQLLLKWLAIADLARIPAVGLQYSGVILHSGVVSTEQLIQTPLDKLHTHIMRLQVKNFQRADLCPSMAEMAIWIKQAQQLKKK
ncbi:DUF4332 domain-containing protein [Pseudanabaena biceps]|nr:DUF4332 domain-containing protein [Pseudanabaena biceps]